MSTLWTPSGGNPEPGPQPEPQQPGRVGQEGPTPAATASDEMTPDAMSEEQVAEEMRRVRAELASTPVVDLVANHAIGLWQLAVLHLTPEEGTAPDLAEASLAIDAMGSIVDGLGDRLGENAAPLHEALSQLRLAFVQVSGRPDTPA